MKIVVYGPEKRTGILSGSEVVDASLACAKLLKERDGTRNALHHSARPGCQSGRLPHEERYG
jgi:hypothetical protein